MNFIVLVQQMLLFPFAPRALHIQRPSSTGRFSPGSPTASTRSLHINRRRRGGKPRNCSVPEVTWPSPPTLCWKNCPQVHPAARSLRCGSRCAGRKGAGKDVGRHQSPAGRERRSPSQEIVPVSLGGPGFRRLWLHSSEKLHLDFLVLS